VRTSIARKFLLIAMAPILACALPLSTIHGVVNRQEEIWIKVGSNEAGLWAMDVATLQTRDLYRWVWLRSYHHQYGEPDRLHDATWRYVFIDCHDQRARFEQFKRMIHDGRLFEGLEGNEAGINELKPYPPQSIIGSVVSAVRTACGTPFRPKRSRVPSTTGIRPKPTLLARPWSRGTSLSSNGSLAP
jgi:hypothetical protein